MDKPYEELQKMVGLTDVKKVVDEILATAKMQKMRKSMGLPKLQTSMHMLFPEIRVQPKRQWHVCWHRY